MSTHQPTDPIPPADNSEPQAQEAQPQPAQKAGWRSVLAKVLPTKQGAKDKPSPNIYPLF